MSAREEARRRGQMARDEANRAMRKLRRGAPESQRDAATWATYRGARDRQIDSLVASGNAGRGLVRPRGGAAS